MTRMANLSPSPSPPLPATQVSEGGSIKNQDNCGPILHFSPLHLWEGLAFPPSCQDTHSTPIPKPKWRHNQEPHFGQFPPLTLSPEGRSPRVQIPPPHTPWSAVTGPSQTNRPVHWGGGGWGDPEGGHFHRAGLGWGWVTACHLGRNTGPGPPGPDCRVSRP